MRYLFGAAVVVGSFGLSGAHASLLVNGDFEATPFDTGWAKGVNPSGFTLSAGSGLVEGSTTAAYLRSGNLQTTWAQSLASPTSTTWSFETLFASEAPGSDTGTATPSPRLLQLSLQHQPEVAPAGGPEGQINLIVTSSGAVQVVSGNSTLNTVISGMNLLPTLDADNNDSFDDPNDVKNVYMLRVTGDYSSEFTAGRVYNIAVIDAATGTTLGSASNLNFFQSTLPTQNAGIHAVEFVTNVSRHTYAVDNVVLSNTVVPEPASVGLLVGGATLLMGRRRRRAK